MLAVRSVGRGKTLRPLRIKGAYEPATEEELATASKEMLLLLAHEDSPGWTLVQKIDPPHQKGIVPTSWLVPARAAARRTDVRCDVRPRMRSSHFGGRAV